MPKRAEELASEIVRLQIELDREIHKRRKALGWRIKENLVEFEDDVLEPHRRLRTGIAGFLARSSVGNILTAPVIYSLVIPFAIIDAWASLYQAICFRAYRITRVKRSRYLILDRQQLAYLNGIQAISCAFCSYANGVVAYVREIGSRTEQYWCPIKHALKITCLRRLEMSRSLPDRNVVVGRLISGGGRARNSHTAQSPAGDRCKGSGVRLP